MRRSPHAYLYPEPLLGQKSLPIIMSKAGKAPFVRAAFLPNEGPGTCQRGNLIFWAHKLSSS